MFYNWKCLLGFHEWWYMYTEYGIPPQRSWKECDRCGKWKATLYPLD